MGSLCSIYLPDYRSSGEHAMLLHLGSELPINKPVLQRAPVERMDAQLIYVAICLVAEAWFEQ